MKKFIMVVIMATLLVGCDFQRKDTTKTDAILFKEEYESLNNKETGYGDKSYRTLKIEKDNPIVYKDASDILEMMDNEETFAVYFGFSSCPWCRSVVPTLIDVAEVLEIPNIYYVDVKDIRDTLKVEDNGEVVTSKEGSDDYYKLLEKLDTVLDDYALTDKDGNDVETNEKRIYAPNIISVIDGVPTKLTTGISDMQTDAFMELSDEIKDESYNKIKNVIEEIATAETTCSTDSKC